MDTRKLKTKTMAGTCRDQQFKGDGAAREEGATVCDRRSCSNHTSATPCSARGSSCLLSSLPTARLTQRRVATQALHLNQQGLDPGQEKSGEGDVCTSQHHTTAFADWCMLRSRTMKKGRIACMPEGRDKEQQLLALLFSSV